MSFLSDYLKYCENNEAHPNYHLWCALITLSSTIGRRVFIDNGHVVIYGNLYVVLVGPPANRKTTAMTVAKKLMREVGGIPFSAESQTKEGLVKLLSEQQVSYNMPDGLPRTYSPLTICVTELKEFLGFNNAHMINFLTTIWDQDFYDYKTRNKEDLTITNPYLTILACETPEWITLRLRDDVISGGFSRRTLFVYETGRPRRIAFPKITDEARSAWSRLVAHLNMLKKVAGEFKWTQESMDFYQNWYEKDMKTPVDGSLMGYFDSKQILVLKVASLIALSELKHEKEPLILRTEYIKAAMEMLEEAEKNMWKVFQGMGRNELNTVSAKMLEILEASPEPILESQLRGVMWKYGDRRELDEIILHLQQSAKITIYATDPTNLMKRYVCVRGREPASVRQLLERGPESKSDSTAAAGPPSAPVSAPSDLTHLLRLSPQSAPKSSDASTNPPPKE